MSSYPEDLNLALYLTRDNLETYKVAQGSWGFNIHVWVKKSDDTLMDLSGCTVRLKAVKSDSTIVYWNGTVSSTDSTEAVWTAQPQLTAAAGIVQLTVEVTAENSGMQSIPCTLKVIAVPDEQIRSTNDFKAVCDALGKVDHAVSQAQASYNAAKNALESVNTIVASEQSRVDSENARDSNEEKRVTAEQTRQAAETKRESDAQAAVSGANAAAGRAGSAAQAAEKIAADVNATIVDQITAKTDIAGGIAGYDGIHSHETNTDIHVTAEQRQAWNNKAEKAITSTTSATAAGWAGDTAPYTQNLSVSGVAEMSTVAIQPSEIATAEQRAAWRAALVSGTAASGKIMLIADGDRPATDIPVSITIWG